MATEEDEIQLVDRAGGAEEDAGIFDRDEDPPPCLRIDYGGGEEEEEEPRKLRSSRSKRWYWWTTLFILTIMMILLIAVPLGIWSDKRKETCFDYESDDESSEEYPFLFLPNKGQFFLCEKGKTKLKGSLAQHHSYIKEERVDVYVYTADTVLNITRMNENCLQMEWSGISSSGEPLVDCFVMKTNDESVKELKDIEWFGAHELFTQTWPLGDMNINMTPFLPHDYLSSSAYQSREVFGSVLHPLWLASNGVGILVDQDTPLSVSIHQGGGEGEICLQAVPYALECIPSSFELTHLHYTVCAHESIATSAKHFLSNHILHPRDVPARETFKDPIWSTWGAFKTNIDDETVRGYLSEITNRGFGISQLELDDGYGGSGSAYGNLSMAIDTKALFREFGVPLTAWVHPFINPMADIFRAGIDDDYFLPGKSKIEGDSISLVRWWHDYGAVINFLDERVANSHKQALTHFVSNYGLSSLKFDAGEVTYLPKCVYTQNVEDPAAFTTAYAAFVGNFSTGVTPRSEVRVGYFSQEQPMWVRMLDRSSTWGVSNGLKSVLTAALTFGIAGYPFVLPDMIGGNGDDPANFGEVYVPDPTLFVRWMQLNAFLPVMQFSIPPFHENFTDLVEGVNVTQHALELTELHRSLADTFYNLSLESVCTGYPIIRPMWWIDSGGLLVDDQFLIGDDIMIAPILESSATSRCVYFPPDTRWTRYHDNKNTTYPGGCQNACERGCQFDDVTLSKFLYFKRFF
ncbi:Myogenesis-regulating glycosidase [Geodia barretti]|uniref:Myogenesis-regulating glycosidase n=1 Tax=Geodia barretti TaxID=519541 RepID=A0AA35QZ48_GEOBA|nr:Myogenesis-regulating glycosidase [Geodia barretti]